MIAAWSILWCGTVPVLLCSPPVWEEVRPEMEKTGFPGASLARLAGRLYDFAVERVVQGVFSGGIRFETEFEFAAVRLKHYSG